VTWFVRRAFNYRFIDQKSRWVPIVRLLHLWMMSSFLFLFMNFN